MRESYVGEKDAAINVSGLPPRVNRWYGVKNDIETKIIAGEYGDAEKLPSITELAQLYDIGTTTAQKVLKALCDDGIIYKKHGVGYYVKVFVKDQLRKQHTEEFEGRVIDLFDYASQIGLTRGEIIEIVNGVIGNRG